MSELVAKTIIKDQYWVVTDGQKKVGNVIANGSQFEVTLNGDKLVFNNTAELNKNTKIIFESVKPKNSIPQLLYCEYPTCDKTYNDFFDIKRKLHIFTKSKKSKCYHVAGYFVININNKKEVIFCPKYIYIQRYEYLGPYKTENEALSNK